MKPTLLSPFLIVVTVSAILVTTACNLPLISPPTPYAPTLPFIPPATPTPTLTISPTPYIEESPTHPIQPSPTLPQEKPTFQPSITPSNETTLPGPQLAFLNEGDIWLLDSPDSQPYPLTLSGDILSFAWSPSGERLAAFNGRELCFLQRDGSVRTACLNLGLDETQSRIARRIVWSPNERWIVLWNSINPWDEDAIGWLIVALDLSAETYRIQDPVDWGAALAPNNENGGFTGQPLFLPDNRLIGTLTHRILCSFGGCHYHLFEFDLKQPAFKPYPNNPQDGWSEGMNLALSRDGQILTNYGVFLLDCDVYTTFLDNFELQTQKRQTYNFNNQAIMSVAFSPDHQEAVFARTSACNSPEQATWSQSCGLSPGFEVFAMQRWSLKDNRVQDLIPGLFPDLSPDGKWLAFQSCLTEHDGQWEATTSPPPAIYLLNEAGEVRFVSPGNSPAWRPKY